MSETVIFHPQKRRLVIIRDGIEVPELEPGLLLWKGEEWRMLRTYGRIANHGGANKPYKTLELHQREHRATF